MNPTAIALRAVAAYKAGDVDGALAALKTVVEATESPEASSVYGMLLVVAGRYSEAIATLSALPETHDTLLALAKAHEGRDDMESAREYAVRAVELDAASNDARIRLVHLDNVLGMRGATVERANDQIPAAQDLPGFTMLREGDFNGFRWLAEVSKPFTNRPGGAFLATIGRDVPRWGGQHVDRLVVILDQGYGDSLQFARWLSVVREHCDHLTVVAEPALHGLLDYMEPAGARWVGSAGEPGAAVAFPANVLHTVTPIERGERVALVVWFG